MSYLASSMPSKASRSSKRASTFISGGPAGNVLNVLRARRRRFIGRAWRPDMRVINLELVLPAAALAFVLFAADRSGSADDRHATIFPKQSFHAKLEYCKTCHGLSGQGYYGYFAMPRLAGQQPKYLENQLRAFVERRRTKPVMSNVAHSLSPSMVAALAAHFRDLNS